MDDEILASRAAVSRRRLLAVGGSIGIGTLLAACGDSSDGGEATVTTTEGTTATIEPTTPATTSGSSKDVVAMLDQAQTCALSKEETQGPYWFDVDSIRSDVTEDRPGVELDLALRVVDVENCDADGSPGAVSNAVVEIWHCDAGGSYSGFESGSAGANGGPPAGGAPPDGGGGGVPPSGAPGGGPGGAPPEGGPGGGGQGGGVPGGSGGTSADGSYAKGDTEATTTDDETYLRGAQVTGKDGIVRFTTIYPGWYRGRTVHIHLKVHVNKKTILTTQMFFDEKLNAAVFKREPYDAHTGRDTFNDGDSIYDASGLMRTAKQGDGYLAVLNLGVTA